MPRTCSVCGNVLACDERYICRTCLAEMPLSHYDGSRLTSMDERFAGKVLIQKCYGYYIYRKGDRYCNIIHDIKYRNLPLMGTWLGMRAAEEAAKWHFFNDIDVIIPVPMHPDKLAKRGYNQAESIAKGVSQATGIGIAHNIVASLQHSTQTHKHREERWNAAMHIYSAIDTDSLIGRHVLLVDDVVTTGATLTNCAKAIAHIYGIRVSIFTLAVADNDI